MTCEAQQGSAGAAQGAPRAFLAFPRLRRDLPPAKRCQPAITIMKSATGVRAWQWVMRATLLVGSGAVSASAMGADRTPKRRQ